MELLIVMFSFLYLIEIFDNVKLKKENEKLEKELDSIRNG